VKRFYKDVQVLQQDKACFVTLDGKKIRTPSRQILKLPNEILAHSIADEWRRQSEDILPSDMPLTQLANTGIDQIGPHRIRIKEQTAAYARTDLLCYRVAAPDDLAERQEERWQPLLDWCEAEFGAKLSVTADLAPLVQTEKSLLAIYTATAQLGDFPLTGLCAATAACGSIVIGMALLRKRLTADEARSLSQLDEEYQSELWGEDPDSVVQRNSVGQAIADAAAFMELSTKSLPTD
jgi:chaperone required for assembly of F1-ATPase